MLDCIVIGAGPGGIVCIKELLEQGFKEIICLEQAEGLGGTFANTYDNLVLTSSASMSMFSDFWIGDGKQHSFWTKAEAIEYWQTYAAQFGVIERIRFNSKVVEVDFQNNQQWQVKLASGEKLFSKRIVLAIGNNSIPSYPSWRNLLTEINYFHSKQYRNPKNLVGKNVLIIGGGESGSEIALEVSRVANKCWVSLRNTTGWIVPRRRGESAADISTHRGLWGLPRDYGATLTEAIYRAELSHRDPVHNQAVELNQKITAQKGVWGIYATKTFSLPEAIVDHGCQVVGEIKKVKDGGRTLLTTNGEILSNIDRIIFATGYRNYVPFLPKELQEIDPRSLYKHMFHSKYREKIVWIGWARPNFGSQFPIMEMQARWLAAIFSGARTLPSLGTMEQIIAEDRAANLEQFEENAEGVSSLIDYYHYIDQLASFLECKPPLWEYFFFHFPIWLRMVYGPTQASQFRLRGDGNKEALAQELLLKLPVSKLTHIVKAGLRGRLLYALQALRGGGSKAELKRQKPPSKITIRHHQKQNGKKAN